jgi:hypothetical protein
MRVNAIPGRAGDGEPRAIFLLATPWMVWYQASMGFGTQRVEAALILLEGARGADWRWQELRIFRLAIKAEKKAMKAERSWAEEIIRCAHLQHAFMGRRERS